jgi:sulfur relay (sulfurtransferase) complex TusBCD TusD component (DsrE family)
VRRLAAAGRGSTRAGSGKDQLVDGARRATLEELTDWTVLAHKMLTF